MAARLAQAGIAFEQADNAFLRIADFERANQLAAELDSKAWHAKLDAYARQYCPVLTTPDLQYQWSILQAEYATDIVFRNQAPLQARFPPLLEALIQAVKPADSATFLGRKLHGNFQDELGTRFNRRWLGRRLKHHMGPVTLKLYAKFNSVLRIKTTVNRVACSTGMAAPQPAMRP